MESRAHAAPSPAPPLLGLPRIHGQENGTHHRATENTERRESHLMTKLTSFPGTTIDLTMVLPASSSAIRGSAWAAARIVS